MSFCAPTSAHCPPPCHASSAAHLQSPGRRSLRRPRPLHPADPGQRSRRNGQSARRAPVLRRRFHRPRRQDHGDRRPRRPRAPWPSRRQAPRALRRPTAPPLHVAAARLAPQVPSLSRRRLILGEHDITRGPARSRSSTPSSRTGSALWATRRSRSWASTEATANRCTCERRRASRPSQPDHTDRAPRLRRAPVA